MAKLFSDSHVQVQRTVAQVRDLLHVTASLDTCCVYRVRVGEIEITYSPECESVYIYLPEYAQAVGPVHTHPYYRDGDVLVNVDHDGSGRIVGIEIV